MSNVSARTLWVKNLSQSSETIAAHLFSSFGGVLRKVINSKDPTQQDILVEFTSDEQANKALNTLQGNLVDGVRLIVQYAPANLTAISTSSVGKTTNARGSVLDRIIKTSSANHPKFDDKPLPAESQNSNKEPVGKLKAETDSPIKGLTDHGKGEISIPNRKKKETADKMEEVHELQAPQPAQSKKIIITKAQESWENGPLKRLILTPKKKLSKRQEKKERKNKKNEVKLIIKHHPDAILNLQSSNNVPVEVSGIVESKQDLIQKTHNNDIAEPLNAHNVPKPQDQPLNDSKTYEDSLIMRSHHNTTSKSRRSPSGHNMRSRSRDRSRSRSGSCYRNNRSYRDRSYSHHRDRQYYDDPRYREPHSHSRRRSRSNSSQRRYDTRNRDLYRNKEEYRRRGSRDYSPRRRRSCSRSLSLMSRSPCGSRCFHSRSRSRPRSFVRSRDGSLSRDSRSGKARELVIKMRDGSIRHKDGYRGEKSLSRERSRERIRRRDSRDRYHSRSRSRSRPRERMPRRGSASSDYRRDANSRSKLSKNGNRYVKKRRGTKKRPNKKFNQKGKQEGARGSQSSTVVNMPEITTNTSQLSINYLIFPPLQNFYAKNTHQNQEEGSDTNLPSYLCPQPKLDTAGGCEAENPGSFHKDANNANLHSNMEENRYVYQKMEEHSNGFEISTIESKSNLADHEKVFDRPQQISHSPEPSKTVESKAEGDGEESKTNYLLTNELVCKNNLRSFINYLVATGDVQGLKDKLKLLEKSK